jgi:hypothetical protein
LKIALALILAFAAVAASPADDGIAIAKRLSAAIKGQAEFQNSDFARPLEASDMAALRGFAPCRITNIYHMLKPDPVERDTYVQNPDQVVVMFGCKGVPINSPAALTLHLRNGKVVRVETHSADLMRAR